MPRISDADGFSGISSEEPSVALARDFASICSSSALRTILESGMSDSTLDLKWRFYAEDDFSLALQPGLTLPTGNEDKGLGTGKTSWAIALLATYEAEAWIFLSKNMRKQPYLLR